MKNRILFLILLAVINVFAQDPKLSDNFVLEVGEEYSETDGRFKKFFKYKDQVIAVNGHKDDLVIQKFDPLTLKELDRVETKKFIKGKIGFNTELIKIGDKIVFLYAQWNRKEKIESLMGVKISMEDLTVGEPFVIIEQQGKVARNGSIFRQLGGTGYSDGGKKYLVRKSFDNEKLLITYRLKPKSRRDSKGNDRFVISVFDTELSLIWKEQVTMPYTEKKMNNEDFTINKDGDFYMLASVYEDDSTDEKKKKEKQANYHLELFKVKKNTNSIITSKISLGEKLIDEVFLYGDSESNIVITGTSKNPDSKRGRLFGKRKGQATGIFNIKLTNEGDVSDLKSYDFPVELLRKYASRKEKRAIKKNDKREDEVPSFERLQINSVVANSDGSCVILGEQRNVEIKVKGSRIDVTYFFDDIMTAKIEADGTLAWMHKLPKRQKGKKGKGTMSYTHMRNNDNHYLMYLDNVKNLDLPEDKEPYLHSDGYGGYFTAYIINDKTGEVKKEAIFNTRDINGVELEHFETDKILPLSDSEILIEGFEGRSKDFLVKVSAKK
ncbi:hypothetical protein [uncultured Aquimarina sp.]|uniref:hypothetical protein n=1 Tax=uncultured Aquimarina sp. TaxID=575652 RepID=UPI00260DBB47|nr:hypothetical protein [uncultured Aquimarina sp.]